jgi:hypothetical protein
VPNIGSFALICTGTPSAVAVQTTRTTEIAAAFPIAPAGIVRVTCVPVAATPFTTEVPRLVVVTFGFAGGVGRVPVVVLGVGNFICVAVIVEESSRYAYPATGSKIDVTVNAALPELAGGVIVSDVATRPDPSRATVIVFV